MAGYAQPFTQLRNGGDLRVQHGGMTREDFPFLRVGKSKQA
jgi:hypothetical protein